MPRFVILAHDWPILHYDFMAEEGEALRTWRLKQAPAPGARLQGEEIAPHRLFYLDYEGPVSNGRGTVKRWDFGTYIHHAAPDGELTFAVSGRKIQGDLRIAVESCEFLFDFSRVRFDETRK